MADMLRREPAVWQDVPLDESLPLAASPPDFRAAARVRADLHGFAAAAAALTPRRLRASLEDDLVLDALRRYRKAAGNTFCAPDKDTADAGASNNDTSRVFVSGIFSPAQAAALKGRRRRDKENIIDPLFCGINVSKLNEDVGKFNRDAFSAALKAPAELSKVLPAAGCVNSKGVEGSPEDTMAKRHFGAPVGLSQTLPVEVVGSPEEAQPGNPLCGLDTLLSKETTEEESCPSDSDQAGEARQPSSPGTLPVRNLAEAFGSPPRPQRPTLPRRRADTVTTAATVRNRRHREEYDPDPSALLCGLEVNSTELEQDISEVGNIWTSWMGWLFGEPGISQCCAAAKSPHRMMVSMFQEPEEGTDEDAEPAKSVKGPPHLARLFDIGDPRMAREAMTKSHSPAAPSVLGPLGAPMPRRPAKRAPPMSAIRELPAQFSSATYDELRPEEVLGGCAGRPGGAWGSLPDPWDVGLELAEASGLGARGGQEAGLGSFCRGIVGNSRSGGGTSALVVELRLPRALGAGCCKRLGSALRAELVPRNDVASPLGAVPLPLPAEGGGAGIWAAWSTPAGDMMGESLQDALQAESAQAAPRRLAIARQICSALHGLHIAGKSHGSLAPRNIWLCPDGDVVLLEAGLAGALLASGALSEPELLPTLGVEFARYLAPEGWQVPRQAGPAADVWALGLVLLEVLGGASPPSPECRSFRHLAAKLLPKGGRHVPQAPAALPEPTRATIEACFRMPPSERPDAQWVLFSLAAPAIEAAPSGVAQLAHTASEPAPPPAPMLERAPSSATTVLAEELTETSANDGEVPTVFLSGMYSPAKEPLDASV